MNDLLSLPLSFFSTYVSATILDIAVISVAAYFLLGLAAPAHPVAHL